MYSTGKPWWQKVNDLLALHDGGSVTPCGPRGYVCVTTSDGREYRSLPPDDYGSQPFVCWEPFEFFGHFSVIQCEDAQVEWVDHIRDVVTISPGHSKE